MDGAESPARPPRPPTRCPPGVSPPLPRLCKSRPRWRLPGRSPPRPENGDGQDVGLREGPAPRGRLPAEQERPGRHLISLGSRKGTCAPAPLQATLLKTGGKNLAAEAWLRWRASCFLQTGGSPPGVLKETRTNRKGWSEVPPAPREAGVGRGAPAPARQVMGVGRGPAPARQVTAAIVKSFPSLGSKISKVSFLRGFPCD